MHTGTRSILIGALASWMTTPREPSTVIRLVSPASSCKRTRFRLPFWCSVAPAATDGTATAAAVATAAMRMMRGIRSLLEGMGRSEHGAQHRVPCRYRIATAGVGFAGAKDGGETVSYLWTGSTSVPPVDDVLRRRSVGAPAARST